MLPNDEPRGDQQPHGREALSGEHEAWESWETWLVTSSVVVGAAALFVLGWLVDRFILS
ncbi:MAG TPA: hypothetical protein VIN61_08765 [Gammaproteobacteria bacterium]